MPAGVPDAPSPNCAALRGELGLPDDRFIALFVGRDVPKKRLDLFLDANDPASLRSFFHDLPTLIDHVMVTAGAPRYGPPLEMPSEEARRGLTERLLLALEVARGAADKVRPPDSLIFMTGTGERRPRAGCGIASTASVALSTLIANLALELAPIRVN